MKALLVSTALLMWCLPAKADPMMIGNGLICDTIDDVIHIIRGEPQTTCGTLRGQFPAEVTLIEPFEYNGMVYALAQYDFLRPVPWGVQTQYGFWGAPQPVEPKGEDA